MTKKIVHKNELSSESSTQNSDDNEDECIYYKQTSSKSTQTTAKHKGIKRKKDDAESSKLIFKNNKFLDNECESLKNKNKLDINLSCKHCVDKLGGDLKLYGALLQFLTVILVLFVLFIGYLLIIQLCGISNIYSIEDIFNSVKKCNLSRIPKLVFIFSLVFFNIITFIIIYFDKSQSTNHGLRINKALIIFLFWSGGNIVGLPLLCYFTFKSKRIVFFMNATLFSFLSTSCLYAYLIWK